MSDRQAVVIDSRTGSIDDLPPQKGGRYRAKLDTLQDVKREMAKVYRESRSEIIDAQTGTKQIWMLQAIGKVISDSDLEKRIEVLEAQQK